MLKTVKIVNLAFNQEFFIDKKKFISKGQCAVNNRFMTAMLPDSVDGAINYFDNNTNVEIEVRQVKLRDIIPGKKFRILNFGTTYTKLEKDGGLHYNHDLHNYTIVLYDTTRVTIINSDSYVYPVE